MAEVVLIRIVLAVIIGVLFGLVYCMRVFVLMERRIARIENHIEKMVQQVLKEELRIENALKVKKRK
ncbi:hypothetical protein COV18_01855 [Candidatus Woesearchaeota archaeon CG10_big_fil_rev_8_21_14_0_10_37_12]|nr:MAG: hypothetical protein COV18_01855 [Candidatus Woesearchaeota archaeon CG10_big_fil_rev_8_21_14_0_10_37_12]